MVVDVGPVVEVEVEVEVEVDVEVETVEGGVVVPDDVAVGNEAAGVVVDAVVVDEDDVVELDDDDDELEVDDVDAASGDGVGSAAARSRCHSSGGLPAESCRTERTASGIVPRSSGPIGT